MLYLLFTAYMLKVREKESGRLFLLKQTKNYVLNYLSLLA